MECNLKANRNNCTCTYEPCARKGRCCECVAYHRQHGEIPGCFFPPEAERTYDRSIDRLITSMRKK
ncbi:MAG: DUF6485 family protein [candidate division WOR-3 bacterium]|uniref:Cytosolic protein n=1 Tax=candidate division WOR-3 bacterium TaxID=2052148 RepID=A0A7C1N987_UNCW3|nr:DUF6485 family protein [candidate division WOR-3 bacterium]